MRLAVREEAALRVEAGSEAGFRATLTSLKCFWWVFHNASQNFMRVFFCAKQEVDEGSQVIHDIYSVFCYSVNSETMNLH